MAKKTEKENPIIGREKLESTLSKSFGTLKNGWYLWSSKGRKEFNFIRP